MDPDELFQSEAAATVHDSKANRTRSLHDSKQGEQDEIIACFIQTSLGVELTACTWGRLKAFGVSVINGLARGGANGCLSHAGHGTDGLHLGTL